MKMRAKVRIAPYLAFGRQSFLERSAYRFEHFMGILNTLLKIFIFWEIYRALYGGRTEVDGITMTMVTTNFVLSGCLQAAFYVDEGFISRRIRDGSIANELLRPVSIQGRMIAENLGHALFSLIFHSAPSLVAAALLVGLAKPASGIMFLLFFFSALLGYGVLWTISFVTQMTAFWLINIWSLNTIKHVLINVLSGATFPLWFMPEWMGGIVTYSPFSSIYFTPVQIYLGQLSYREIAYKCLIQMVWIGVIYAVGAFLWTRGQKKLVVQGG